MLARVVLAILATCFAAWGAVEFNRDVRPLLSDKCFMCHGPDAAARKVPLRLDREEFAKADLGKGRRAIVAGDPDRSELIRRITTPAKGLRMPPLHTGVQLTEREIGTLRDWITEGAQWQAHWSLIPPEAAVPETTSSWVRNTIDRFVLDRLEKEKLTPSPEAEAGILLRRASLAITGLPPSPAELDRFLADRGPGAYERAVDRMLASPRYGERMAARWLDAARYADTNGYQFDGPRVMWRWRDWVIEAFNSNKPFDRFIVEQLAGDLLPNPARDQLVATGFNRNHRINTEDGIVPEEYFVEQVVDRVETTSTVFLGLTLGCARCHNHKYDPFTQKEFYQLYAFFNNLPEAGRGMKYGNTPPLAPAPTAEQQKVLDDYDRRIGDARGVLARGEAEIAAGQRKWTAPAANWEPESAREYSLGKTQFDGKRVIDAGRETAAFDIEDPFSISAWVYSDTVPDGSIASRMSDNPRGKGYGLHLNGGRLYFHITSNWADDAIRIESAQVLGAGQWRHVAVTYDGSRLLSGVTLYIDGKPVEYRIETATLYRPFRNAGSRFREPLRVGGGWGEARRFKGTIDRLRVYSRKLESVEVASLGLKEQLAGIAQIPERERSEAESYALRQAFLASGASPVYRDAWGRLASLQLERDRAERSFPTVMVMAEMAEPRPAHLLLRGAYDKPGERWSGRFRQCCRRCRRELRGTAWAWRDGW